MQMETEKERCDGFLYTDHTDIIEHNVRAYPSPISPQVIAKACFKPDECKVVSTKLIAMGTAFEPFLPIYTSNNDRLLH